MEHYILLFNDTVLACGEFFTLLNIADEHAEKHIPGMRCYLNWKNMPYSSKEWEAFKPGDMVIRSESELDNETRKIEFYSIWRLPNRSEDPESYEYYTHK